VDASISANSTTGRMRAAAVAGLAMAIVSLLVSALHSMPDVAITLARNGAITSFPPTMLSFPYWVAGTVGDPIVIVTAAVVGIGLLAAARRTGQRTARSAAYGAFCYAGVRAVWAITTILYASALGNLTPGSNLSDLASLALLKGLAGAAVGITGGLVMASFLLLYFARTKVYVGKTGALLIMMSVPFAMLSKASSGFLWTYVMAALSLILMAVKSIGIGMMSVALWQQAYDPRTEDLRS
jgi:hypothetical protein